MRAREDGGLAALRGLLRTTHHAGPDDLPALVAAAGQALGAERAVLYLVDYEQVRLVPLVAAGSPHDTAAQDPAAQDAVAQDAAPQGSVAQDAAAQDDAPQPVPIEGTLAGRAFSDVAQHLTTTGQARSLWTPLLDGTDRLGVLQLEIGADVEVEEDLLRICADVASLLAELVVTRSLYGDAVERARRAVPMMLPAELQWRLLPPLTFAAPRVAVSGILAPTHEVAGDSFDYALNGHVLHVAVADAMGHGLESTLLSAVAVSTLRNARRGGLTLAATVQAMDAALSAQFGPDRFVTAIVGELDTTTGWWRWASCGHPPALLVRSGRVVKELDDVVGVPLGLGLLQDGVELGSERLEPGDRLLLYSDGVVEARDADGEFFGAARLAELVTREDAARRPAAETLRRLNHAILAHQEGELQDDATTVLVEWLTDEPDRSTPLAPQMPPS